MARTTKSTSSPASTEAPQIFVDYSSVLLKSTVLVFLLGLASLATQLALHPLYGNTATSLNHPKVKLIACLISALLPLDSAHPSEKLVLVTLASWVGYASYATYALGKWTTTWRNPALGSAVAEAMVLVPVISLGVALIRRWNSRSLWFLPGPMSQKAMVTFGTFNILNIVESWLWQQVPLGGVIHSSNIFVASAATLTLLTGLAPPPPKAKLGTKLVSRSYKPLLLLLPVLTSALALALPPNVSPHLPYTRKTRPPPLSSLNPTPPATVRVLARTHSVTGLILVGEHVEESFRFLRADHSLLGGRWMGNKIPTGARDGLGDSIYAAFVLQEAARLVEKHTSEKTEERALFIGLGVGIAAQAFISHGISTSIVEIDPAVYAYAREYFGLAEPHHVYIEDAREWVHRHAYAAGIGEYDYVVHDCFSGGGVPKHIFTLEFWEALKHVVKSDGVVAVNFAGKLGSNAARAIFLTLQKSFGRCRVFHDHLEAELDPTYTFFNVVFFCTPSSAGEPTFRSATEDDYLDSHLRRHVLGDLAQREIDGRRILGDVTYISKNKDEANSHGPGGGNLLVEGEDMWILRDNSNQLGEWQQTSGLEHWNIMREVLPDVFWETY